MNAVDLPDNMGDWNQRTNSAQWAPDTVVELFNVPWNSDYRDIVDFTNGTLNGYLNSKVSENYRVDRMVYLRPYEPIRLNIPFNAANHFNYIRVKNPVQPVSGDQSADFYYFINDLRYVAPNTTELHIQIDVWSTYRHELTPGYGYVERGHVGIANSNSFEDYGRKYLTVPEGLDIGNEYSIAAVSREKIADRDSYSVIVWSTVDLTASVVSSTTDQPVVVTAGGTLFGGMPNGAAAYLFESKEALTDWLGEHSSMPWVTQGIISIMAMPDVTRYGFGNMPPSADGMVKLGSFTPNNLAFNLFENWRDHAGIPSRYAHLHKFKTFPYMVLELTTNTGAPLALKPEQWDGNHARVREMPHLSMPSPRIAIYPIYYNRQIDADNPDTVHDGGEFLDMTTGIYDFPTFSVVNNGYLSYMAANRNSIQYQHQSADWSQQKALRGADVAHGQAQSGATLSQRQSNIQARQMDQTTNLGNQAGVGRAFLGGAGSLVTGAMGGPRGLAGGAMGAAQQGLGEVINHAERNQQNTINTGAVRDSQRAIQSNMQFQRDSNRDLAQYAAKGDYANAIAGINAKVQDAKVTQPTSSGQVGGEAFNLAVDQWGYDLKIKVVNSGAMRVIGEYWLRYGYAVNAYMVPSTFNVMSRFTYWKFQEFYVQTSAMPEMFKNAIRGIFEKGVTVWSHPDYVGTTDPGNNDTISDNYY